MVHRVMRAPYVTDSNGTGERAVMGVTPGRALKATHGQPWPKHGYPISKRCFEDMRGGVEDMKRDQEEWRTQAQALRLAVPKPKPPSWWRWLRTTAER
jgi:hypothetical protein